MKLLSLLALLLMAKVHAYSVLTLKPVDWEKVKTVDVFVAGYGKELGLQFLYSAITKAQYHDDLYPDSRAQLILWARERSSRADQHQLERRGFTVEKVSRRDLTHNIIAYYLQKLPKIASFHIFSHNSANGGNAIQKGMRLSAKNFPWQEVASNFAPDSYVILHGCNTGFVIAPEISERLKRPVLGSLSSTDFQEIWDGKWFHNNSGQYPLYTPKSKTNHHLFNQSKQCWKGFCHRLMANNHTYRGHWGSYEVGLPYYKSFCNFELGTEVDNLKCMRGIAKAIEAWPTIGRRSWQKKVEDFLCPRLAGKSTYRSCVANLHGWSNKKFFAGNTLKCTLKECQFGFKMIDVEGDRVRIFTGSDAGVEPFKSEYNFLMSLEKHL